MRRFQQIGIVVLTWHYFNSQIFGIGTAFLTVPSDPRELALGGASTSIIGDPSLSRGNPALIVQNNRGTEIYFSYNRWLAGAKGSSVLIVQQALGGSLGFGVRHLALSDLELRTSRPTDDYLALFSTSGTVLEGTWGRRLDRLRIGATIRWIRMESYIYSSSGFGLDLGILWPLIRNKISIGAAIQNLGSMNTYLSDSPELPMAISGGITYQMGSLEPSRRDKFHSSLNVGMELSEMHGLVTRVAGELFVGDGRITLGTRLSQEVTTMAGGVSLNWRRFQVGYAVEIGSHRLGIPHLLRIRLILP